MDIFSCARGAKVRGLGEGGSQPPPLPPELAVDK